MRQLLSALSYFSIFFAPFILPVIIWILCREDAYVAMHSKRALLSHILPFVAALPLLVLTFGADNPGSVLGYIILFIIIYFGTVIYNIVKGVQVLREYA
ncbi:MULTISPECIES: DUF4870 domain-containing protein [Paenibacillus]|uniref:DUF4870 domain-containing protein n=1 Tax=Paenibacillus albilobatus TaxID=2716884 RepID=A0A920CEC3_9BACL|nr:MULTISPECIES: DUF4870 domain-containing protein [Paenibacillus]GIO34693.1 hypothetical protein J2TS6_58340 [Paenibacillus albilobatus]